MDTKFHLDSLDRRILSLLTKNARTPFLEIARACNVSGAAIHQRIQRLQEANVITGSQFNISPKGVGFTTCAFIGLQVQLSSVSTHEEVFAKIKQIKEIVECHHVTGQYSLLIKIYSRDNEHLKEIIVKKIQSIPEITSTETFLSLQEGFFRQLPVEG
ncbi:MAG: Lrp/AsnC ligand binding domain-containing protein [Bacteroidetes bacterium]|nr:Lrp/AsnC ligand binding domain-containing protein [Bacteroidota bacterium]